MTKSAWEIIAGRFRDVAERAEDLAQGDFCLRLEQICDTSGEMLFEMIDNDYFIGNPFKLSGYHDFTTCPVTLDIFLNTKTGQPEMDNMYYYGAYWVCSLVYFDSRGLASTSNDIRKKTTLPITKADDEGVLDWSTFDYFRSEHPDRYCFFISEVDYIREVASASAQACEILAHIWETTEAKRSSSITTASQIATDAPAHQASSGGTESTAVMEEPDQPADKRPLYDQDSPEWHIVLLHQRHIETNEKRKEAGRKPLAYFSSRKLLNT